MNLSEEGIQLIIEFESGGRSYWQNKCLDKPNWPGFSSGVTIGIGYDLGYCTASKFVSDWQEIYGERDLYQLKNVCGITGEDAKPIVKTGGPLHEVRPISWDDAVTVFAKRHFQRITCECCAYILNLKAFQQNAPLRFCRLFSTEELTRG